MFITVTSRDSNMGQESRFQVTRQ